jgi:Flp pilus assembly protein TadD
MPTPNRLSFSLVALLLGCTALSGSAQAGWFSSDDAKPASDKKAIVKGEEVQPAATLDGSIRQAQLLRLAGQYPEAIKHLSQLMVVAADDGRVITEYGKTLAAMGRAQESVDFLTRAQQLSPGDWSVYSALGVAYDQLGKHDQAQGAYEHALTLRPGEPSVLNNYALSRMLSKDPEGARKLIARAESAGGASDPKIARTIAMMKSLAPEAADKSLAAATPTPSQVAQNAPPQPAPRTPVVQRSMPAAQMASNQSAPFVNIPAPPPVSAPRQLMPAANSVIEPSHQLSQPTNAVVMQRVPVDPLAGPVLPKVATHAPRALAKVEKPEDPKPQPAKVAETKPAPVKTAAAEALDLQAQDLQKKADAIAKQLNGKPAAIAAAKAEASKPVVATSKAPAPPPAVKPQPTKVAEARPAPVKSKPKDSIPGLRLSANAY